jgi:hypothetical protein
VLLKKLGDDLVFLLQLGLQIVDFFFPGGFALAPPGGLLECRRGVVEEDFLSVVDVVGLDPVFVAEVRDRHLVDDIPLQNGDFPIAIKSSTLLVHGFLLT